MTQDPVPAIPSAALQPVLVWVTEGTWRACVDGARALAPEQADVVLLHVTPEELPDAAHGAYAGLLGRGHRDRDPGTRLETLSAASAGALLAAAAERLGRPCAQVQRRGRVEREVVSAAQDAGLLVAARDGDRSHLGPASLGRATRFVVDHAPCAVLLVWPETAPGIDTIPPPPPHGRPPHGGPPPGPPHGRPRHGGPPPGPPEPPHHHPPAPHQPPEPPHHHPPAPHHRRPPGS